MGARAPALPISRSSDFGRSIHGCSGPSGGTCPCRAIEAHFSVTSYAHRVFRFWIFFCRIPFRFFARLSVRLTPSLSLSGAFLFGHFILFLFWAIQSAWKFKPDISSSGWMDGWSNGLWSERQGSGTRPTCPSVPRKFIDRMFILKHQTTNVSPSVSIYVTLSIRWFCTCFFILHDDALFDVRV